MYNFVDVLRPSGEFILPSEALRLNGNYLEVLIPGYRTLTVSGREALSPELTYFETGSRDGSTLKNKRYPSRTIVVRYQLIAKSNEEFREAYNRLAEFLDVEEAELIFDDEPDKFYIGTPSAIGEVEPGKNAVVGEFEIFCADPFKYSVVKYVALPNPTDDSILIDYGGTHKAFPTLEAQFDAKDGDCGYVAFFNEDKKIIQLGDPDETDTETYEKSQTLVNQYFDTETSWGTIEELNWGTNVGISSSVEHNGSVSMGVAHYNTTVAPSTSGTLLTKTSKQAKPYVDYAVTAKTKNRTANSIDVEVTIKASVTVATNAGSTKVASGATVKLNSTKLYASSTATTHANTLTGTYYLWDSSVINGRIRITNLKSRVGVSGQVTGWVKTTDISIGDTTTANSQGKGYGLKGAVQISGGDWFYATIKKESAVWSESNSYTAKITIPVKNIEADLTKLENIKFKVERTDDNSSKMGLIDETYCKDLEISAYTAPTPDAWYLTPQTYGTGSGWHGVSITRQVPADAAGDIGARNFSLSFQQKMACGTNSVAPQELGLFQALLVSGSGSSRKIVAGVTIRKSATGNNGEVRFIVNNKVVQTVKLDLSYNNKYFGQDTAKLSSVKTSVIKKVGKKVEFNIGGIKRTFNDANIKDVYTKEITFTFAKYGTKPELSYNGLYRAKFIKFNCDKWEDIRNKFTSGDVVTADCKSGEVLLNNSPTPSLGALGNDWEDFYLTPGLNQIGFSYSDWVNEKYKPEFKLRYREVFI